MNAIPEVVVGHDRPELAPGIRGDVIILLKSIPRKYLAGLRMIRLAAACDFTRARRRAYTRSRGRRIPIQSCLGLYHQAWKGTPASIELFVDNFCRAVPRWALIIPFVRRILLAKVLFHEVGHHIHRTLMPERREREDVADRWAQRLGRRLLYRRYWYLAPVLYPAAVGMGLMRRFSGSRPTQRSSGPVWTGAIAGIVAFEIVAPFIFESHPGGAFDYYRELWACLTIGAGSTLGYVIGKVIKRHAGAQPPA